MLSSKLYRLTKTWLPPPQRKNLASLSIVGRKFFRFLLCSCLQPLASGRSGQGPCTSPSICLHEAHWIPGSAYMSRICAPARISPAAFSCNLLFKITFWEAIFLASSSFQHQSLCSSQSKPGHRLRQKHNIWSVSLVLSQAWLLIVGFSMCHYILPCILTEFTTE